MNKLISVSSALATVAGIGVSGYMIGQSNSTNSSGEVKVTINNAISNLSQDKQNAAKELLEPILEMMAAQSGGSTKADGKELKTYGDELKVKLEEFSLISYQAAKSPFIPPEKKTQFFCDNQFRFSYKGLWDERSTEAIRFTVEGSTKRLSIGEPRKYFSGDKSLEIVYLSYDNTRKGPILQYTCS